MRQGQRILDECVKKKTLLIGYEVVILWAFFVLCGRAEQATVVYLANFQIPRTIIFTGALILKSLVKLKTITFFQFKPTVQMQLVSQTNFLLLNVQLVVINYLPDASYLP